MKTLIFYVSYIIYRVDYNNIIPNWEIIKRLNETNNVPQQQQQQAEHKSSETFRNCCTAISSHFYALSTKRKC